MWVRNKGSTGERACRCGSWLRHWERATGHKEMFCASTLCFAQAELGGHIYLSQSVDQGVYIVPLCARCSLLTGDFEVNAKLVPAGERAFCGVDRALFHREIKAIQERRGESSRP